MLAGRSRRRSREKPRAIPEDLAHIVIVTDARQVNKGDAQGLASTRYRCTPTRFRVWSFLRPRSDHESGPGGQLIYHVSPEIHFRRDPDSPHEETLSEESFYATIHLQAESKREALAGKICRGRLLEFHKCHVGGSLNGVETGEKLVTMTPVVDYHLARKEAGQGVDPDEQQAARDHEDVR